MPNSLQCKQKPSFGIEGKKKTGKKKGKITMLDISCDYKKQMRKYQRKVTNLDSPYLPTSPIAESLKSNPKKRLC